MSCIRGLFSRKRHSQSSETILVNEGGRGTTAALTAAAQQVDTDSNCSDGNITPSSTSKRQQQQQQKTSASLPAKLSPLVTPASSSEKPQETTASTSAATSLPKKTPPVVGGDHQAPSPRRTPTVHTHTLFVSAGGGGSTSASLAEKISPLVSDRQTSARRTQTDHHHNPSVFPADCVSGSRIPSHPLAASVSPVEDTLPGSVPSQDRLAAVLQPRKKSSFHQQQQPVSGTAGNSHHHQQQQQKRLEGYLLNNNDIFITSASPAPTTPHLVLPACPAVGSVDSFSQRNTPGTSTAAEPLVSSQPKTTVWTSCSAVQDNAAASATATTGKTRGREASLGSPLPRGGESRHCGAPGAILYCPVEGSGPTTTSVPASVDEGSIKPGQSTAAGSPHGAKPSHLQREDVAVTGAGSWSTFIRTGCDNVGLLSSTKNCPATECSSRSRTSSAGASAGLKPGRSTSTSTASDSQHSVCSSARDQSVIPIIVVTSKSDTFCPSAGTKGTQSFASVESSWHYAVPASSAINNPETAGSGVCGTITLAAPPAVVRQEEEKERRSQVPHAAKSSPSAEHQHLNDVSVAHSSAKSPLPALPSAVTVTQQQTQQPHCSPLSFSTLAEACASRRENTSTTTTTSLTISGSQVTTHSSAVSEGSNILVNSPSSDSRLINNPSGSNPVNTLSGSNPVNTLSGSNPVNTLSGSNPVNTLSGSNPVNTLSGSNPVNTLSGSNPVNTLSGGNPVNSLSGSNPVNTLSGSNPVNNPSGSNPVNNLINNPSGSKLIKSPSGINLVNYPSGGSLVNTPSSGDNRRVLCGSYDVAVSQSGKKFPERAENIPERAENTPEQQPLVAALSGQDLDSASLQILDTAEKTPASIHQNSADPQQDTTGLSPHLTVSLTLRSSEDAKQPSSSSQPQEESEELKPKTEDLIIATDTEDRIIATDTEDQIISTETEDRIISTETEDRIISTETEDRSFITEGPPLYPDNLETKEVQLAFQIQDLVATDRELDLPELCVDEFSQCSLAITSLSWFKANTARTADVSASADADDSSSSSLVVNTATSQSLSITTPGGLGLDSKEDFGTPGITPKIGPEVTQQVSQEVTHEVTQQSPTQTGIMEPRQSEDRRAPSTASNRSTGSAAVVAPHSPPASSVQCSENYPDSGSQRPAVAGEENGDRDMSEGNPVLSLHPLSPVDETEGSGGGATPGDSSGTLACSASSTEQRSTTGEFVATALCSGPSYHRSTTPQVSKISEEVSLQSNQESESSHLNVEGCTPPRHPLADVTRLVHPPACTTITTMVNNARLVLGNPSSENDSSVLQSPGSAEKLNTPVGKGSSNDKLSRASSSSAQSSSASDKRQGKGMGLIPRPSRNKPAKTSGEQKTQPSQTIKAGLGIKGSKLVPVTKGLNNPRQSAEGRSPQDEGKTLIWEEVKAKGLMSLQYPAPTQTLKPGEDMKNQFLTPAVNTSAVIIGSTAKGGGAVSMGCELEGDSGTEQEVEEKEEEEEEEEEGVGVEVVAGLMDVYQLEKMQHHNMGELRSALKKYSKQQRKVELLQRYVMHQTRELGELSRLIRQVEAQGAALREESKSMDAALQRACDRITFDDEAMTQKHEPLIYKKYCNTKTGPEAKTLLCTIHKRQRALQLLEAMTYRKLVALQHNLKVEPESRSEKDDKPKKSTGGSKSKHQSGSGGGGGSLTGSAGPPLPKKPRKVKDLASLCSSTASTPPSSIPTTPTSTATGGLTAAATTTTTSTNWGVPLVPFSSNNPFSFPPPPSGTASASTGTVALPSQQPQLPIGPIPPPPPLQQPLNMTRNVAVFSWPSDGNLTFEEVTETEV